MRNPGYPGRRSFYIAFAASFVAAIILVTAINYFQASAPAGRLDSPFMRVSR